MKTIAFLTALFAISLSVKQTIAQQARDWNAEFKQLLTYDREYGPRLKASDGSWIQPKPEIAALLKKLSPEINRVAKQLKVDPRAIAGAILAENSMNVGISDGAQDWLVKAGLAKNGKILGKSFTFGLGQLNFDAAREAEDFVAKAEGRRPLSNQELEKALLDPAGAIKMVGQVLRQAQDVYQKHGFDISKRPDILTTVYNLGKPEERARAAKSANRLPRPNYFGFFVDHYLTKIESTINYSQASVQQVTITSPKPKETPKSAAANTPKLVKRQLLSRSLALVQSPPTCMREMYGNDPKGRYESYRSFATVGVAERGRSWSLVSPGFDCEGQNWALVRTEDGVLGWAKKDDLDQSTTTEFAEASGCTTSANGKCKSAVEKTAQKKVAEADPKSKLTYLYPEAASGTTPHFKRQDWTCGIQPGADSMPGTGSSSKYRRMATPPSAEKNTIEELGKLRKEVDEVVASFGDMTDPENPYFSLETEAKLLSASMSNCIRYQTAGIPCAVELDRIRKSLLQVQVIRTQNKNPNLDSLRETSKWIGMANDEFMRTLGFGGPGMSGFGIKAVWAATPEHLARMTLARAKEGLSACRSELDKLQLKNSLTRLDFITSSINGVQEADFVASNYHELAADTIRLCSATAELFGGAQLKSQDPDLLAVCDAKYGKVVDASLGQVRLLKRELAKHTIERDMGLDGFLSNQLSLLSMGVPNRHAVQSGAGLDPGNGGYCPNLTAQWIEELLQNNKCISKVFVPDPWLVSRLNGLGSKIIYRPFERDDVFAVDYSEVKCK